MSLSDPAIDRLRTQNGRAAAARRLSPGPRNLDKLVRPRTIAVVGASARESSAGGAVMRTLDRVGFTGSVFPVNPRYDEVLGHRCYRSLDDLPEVPDAVFIGLAAAPSLEALRAAGERGVGAAVIHAAGFADAGAAGTRLQRELVRVADSHEIALSGPNNMGLLNVLDGTGMWTLPLDQLIPGPVAVISQSGSAAIALSEDPKRLGLAYIFTAGNEAVLSVTDYLAVAVTDARVEVIVMFLESIRDPGRFANLARQAVASGNRIIAIKVGRSTTAQAAVRSHTDAIAGDDETYAAFLEQCGVVRADDFDELLELAALFAAYPEPPSNSRSVAFTVSGGEAALVADLAAAAGVALPELRMATRRRLQETLGTFALPLNPIDAWGRGWDSDQLRRALEQLTTETEIPSFIAVLDAPASGGGDVHIAREMLPILSQLRQSTGRYFIALNTTAAFGVDRQLADFAAKLGVPCLSGLRGGLAAIRRWATYAPPPPLRPRRRRIRRAPLAELRAHLERGDLDPGVAPQLLTAVGVPMAPAPVVGSGRAALDAARRIGYPVVMKGHGDGILHKNHLGLVEIGVHGRRAVSRSFARIQRQLAGAGAAGTAVTVSPQERGFELFVGVRNDPQFGPVTILGLGGTDVEALGAVAVHVGDVDPHTARAMLHQIPATAVLRRPRGEPAYDLGATAAAVAALCSVTIALEDMVQSIEVNPLIVRDDGGGVVGVDLVVVRQPVPSSSGATG